MNYSIVIPAFNEEQAIKNVLLELNQKLTQTGHSYEIIVVNDGSTDRTKEEILASGLPIVLVNQPANHGYGASLKVGIKKAQYNHIVITDADATYPNERIPELVSLALKDDWDMVVGARTGKNAKIPLVRKPAKWCIGKLANYLGEYKIPDINSGLRVMKKEIVKKFFNILPSGFSFTTTITLAMLTNGYNVKYVPIDYHKRSGKSKIKPIKDTLNFIQLIVRTVLYFNPLKIFIPMATTLFFIAILILVGSRYFLGVAMDVTFGIILMTSVMVLAVGMLADLIDKRLK